MKLPSKKIIPLIIACVIALGVIIFGFLYGSKTPTKVANRDDAVSPAVIIEKMQAVDTDHDNLPDWEEALWKSDAKNPDTDGDGTKDGDEVNAGRDPVRKGPKDLLSQPVAQLPSNDNSSEAMTATEKFSQRLLNQYTQYKQIGALQTKDGIDSLAKSLSDQAIKEIKLNQKVYTESDIKIKQSWTKADLVTYGNSFGTVVTKNSPSNLENELAIFKDATENQNADTLKKLDPIITGYQGMIHDLLLTPVPSDLSTIHLSIINDMSTLLEEIKGFRVIFTDPLYSYMAVSSYLKDAPKMLEDFKKLHQFLVDQNISYQPGDPGYLLLQANGTQ